MAAPKLIDHAMLSPALAPMVTLPSSRIPNSPEVFTLSDHAPLSTTYAITAP